MALKKLSIPTFSVFGLGDKSHRVVKVPLNRSGKIEMAVGRDTNRSVRISVPVFESLTGCYISGLEPVLKFNHQDEIERFKRYLAENDFTLRSDSKAEISAFIKYATKNNTKGLIEVFSTNNNHYFSIHVLVSKANGTQREQFSGPATFLPELIDQAIEFTDKKTRTKVQILSQTVSENTSNTEREFSEHGIPILFRNESISTYFKQQSMPAGAVINNIGQHQCFTSYLSEGDHMSLHHDVRSYKTLKGAQKYLKGQGYDLHGKQLPVIDHGDFINRIREKMRFHRILDSYSDHYISHTDLKHGWLEILSLDMKEDSKLGAVYSFSAQYTDEDSGRTKSVVIPVNARKGGNVDSTFHRLYGVYNEYSRRDKFKDVEFDEDLRSESEKLAFHQEREASFHKMYERFKELSNQERDDKCRTQLLEKAELNRLGAQRHHQHILAIKAERRKQQSSCPQMSM